MSWVKRIFGKEDDFSDALLPDEFQDNVSAPRRLIDLCYELFGEETKGLPYKICTCSDRHYVTLWEVYRNPVPFLELLSKKVGVSIFQTGSNLAHFIPYRALFLGDQEPAETNSARIMKGNVIHTQQRNTSLGFSINDWGLLANIMKLAGWSAFKPCEEFYFVTELPARFQAWSDEWHVNPRQDRVHIKQRRVDLKDAPKDVFLAYLQHPLEQLPTVLRNCVLEKASGHVIENTIELPLRQLLSETKECMEEGIIFAFYLYARFIDAFCSRCLCYHRTENLSWRMYSWEVVDISRTELLGHVRQRFPGYDLPRELSDAILTQPEWQERRPSTPPPAQQAAHAEEISCVLENGALINLVEREPDWELNRYVNLLQLEAQYHRFRVSGEPLHLGQYDALAMCLLNNLPEFRGQWDGKPRLLAPNLVTFWERTVWEQTSATSWGCKGDSLRYFIFSPPYGGLSCNGQKVIETIDTDVFERLFCAPFHENEWTVVQASTNNAFFINDWYDFLFVAFHRSGTLVTVIYGTGTD